MSEKWRNEHGKIIQDFLEYLNKQSDNYILKGETALMTCYHLDRFSEDIDLDSDAPNDEDIKRFIGDYCHTNEYDYSVSKETEITKCYAIYYKTKARPLNVSVSYQNKCIDKKTCTKINGINVYKINSLALMKAAAYAARDELCDIYDLTFIANHYWSNLNSTTKAAIKIYVSHKGLAQLNYILNSQQDTLVDSAKLYAGFLKMYDRLGLS